MNIIKAGSDLQIYNGEDVQTFSTLPLGTYTVNFNPMRGFYLSIHENLIVKENKLYGSTIKKVDKVIRAYQVSNRNFGIILSGQKGSGKSLFAKRLSELCLENNLPIIIVDSYFPGIASFLSSIDQEVMVLFDEFEKTFSVLDNNGDDNDKPQEELLTLFDGINNGKKLFVVICNETYNLNSFLLDRPGRFHYHFTLGTLTAEEVIEYMTDCLNVKYHSEIPKIVNLLATMKLTYDILRAIAFDLNLGYDLKETLTDLNAKQCLNLEVSILIETKNKNIYSARHGIIDLSQKTSWFSCCLNSDNNKGVSIKFNNKDIRFDGNNINIPIDKCEFVFGKYDHYRGIECDDGIKPEEVVFLEIKSENEYRPYLPLLI